ncbi:hypothetical protein RHSIM_Rhsim03G0111300 [Rhododendron simsii]|uniref:SWIM-type domain-containing protein n=1 Tax=Rhododendron simsii TaxID=118357 RepID=A0A834H524_RHOSS|nr:hypothetical protein RHSIM_Rhsim03G0111300 [Rhododendron simsii]
MHSSGFKQLDIYSYMSTEAGGPQYLNFIPTDCYNLIQKKRAGFLKKGDSQCLLEYFKQKTQENKHFFYTFHTTNENEVRGVFFCDAKSRRDYGLFGDAICFATTFRTNNYDMLCAPIVGIHNHGQTMLFGCGLLDGETTDAREAFEKYTKKVFYLFQKEYQQTLDLSLKLENDDGTISTYIVKELKGWKKIRKLVYNPLEHSVSCTCRKFEFHGILCSHSLKLFHDLQYESLPSRYYLKRWTRTIVDEDVFDLHGDLIPNDTDPLLTIRYSGLSQISQRIVSKGSKYLDVSSLTEIGLLELEAKVESWIISRCANQNVASNVQNSSTLNVDDEAPLRDPTKRQRQCQVFLFICLFLLRFFFNFSSGKGVNSATKAMTRSKSLKENEEDENAHDTTSTQGPHVEQPNMAANVLGMNALQVPNSSCTSGRQAIRPTFTEMLLNGYEV